MVAVYKHEATVPVSESLDRGSGRARPWGPSPLGSARVTSLWVAHRLTLLVCCSCRQQGKLNKT